MESLWKWLMRANARWIFACALLALLLVTAWWTWKELSPLEPEQAVSTSGKKREPVLSLGLLQFLDQYQAAEPVEAPEQVFLLAWEPGKAPRVDPKDPFPLIPGLIPVVTNTPVHNPPPPARDTVSLTYRGLFQRSDGKVLALIEDSKSGGSLFYPKSGELFGLKVDGIDTQQVSVVLSDGSVTTLKIKEPQVFEGGKRAQ